MNESDLKITALKQRIGEITSDYEERIADLRVNLTVMSQMLNEKTTEVERLNAVLEEANKSKGASEE